MDERTERISLRVYEIWERLGRPKGGTWRTGLRPSGEIDAEMTSSDASDPMPMPVRRKPRRLRNLRSLNSVINPAALPAACAPSDRKLLA